MFCIIKAKTDNKFITGGVEIIGPFSTELEAALFGQHFDNPNWNVEPMTCPPSQLIYPVLRPYTVFWGNIGDGCERRMDYVMAYPNHESIMDAAWKIAYEELNDYSFDFEKYKELSFDGFGIVEGHVKESQFSFS